MSKIRFLSNNTLKIIAALAMLADHVGYLLFPDVTVLRIIGRLAFPIFAFTIAEGCKYTRKAEDEIFLLRILSITPRRIAGNIYDCKYMRK